MNFSELFKQTGQLCKFSPDGNYLANAVQYRLIIRDTESLQIVNLFTCLDEIQCIDWSPDSQFIACGMFKRGMVQAWSIDQPEWTCKIDEGSAGLIKVVWSPDSRHILTTAEFHLRITVWSLLDKSVSYIKYPKDCQNGLDFNSLGSYMALAERRDCKDFVSIFDCQSWQLVKHFSTETEDLNGIKWAPNGRVLCVWDSHLEYKVKLFTIDGRCIGTHSAYQYAPGTKSVSWSPSSQFVAIGSFDQKVRLLNHLTWKLIVEFEHPKKIDSGTVVYREVVRKPPLLKGETSVPPSVIFSTQSRYEVEELPVQVPAIQPDLSKASPKVGVGLVKFSPDNRFLYTRNDNMPNCLWIWSILDLKPTALLIQDAPIKCVAWDPSQARLALCTGTNKLYMWSVAGCLSVEIPAEATFLVTGLSWHPSGNAIILTSRDQMCICFVSPGGDGDS